MTYAIETYFIGPSNVRGSRIAARVMERGTGWAGEHPQRKITLPWVPELGLKENHLRAALTLAEKLGWAGEWVEGGGDHGASIWIRVSDIAQRFKARGDLPLEQRL